MVHTLHAFRPLQPELNFLAANSGIYRRAQLVPRGRAITRLLDLLVFSVIIRLMHCVKEIITLFLS